MFADIVLYAGQSAHGGDEVVVARHLQAADCVPAEDDPFDLALEGLGYRCGACVGGQGQRDPDGCSACYHGGLRALAAVLVKCRDEGGGMTKTSLEPFGGCLRLYIQDRLDISHDKRTRK